MWERGCYSLEGLVLYSGEQDVNCFGFEQLQQPGQVMVLWALVVQSEHLHVRQEQSHSPVRLHRFLQERNVRIQLLETTRFTICRAA